MLPSIGITELIVIGIVAILLFGKRLPEVARNVGRGYGELRKGLTELQTSINSEIDASATTSSRTTPTATNIDDLDEPTAPRLEPPPADEQN